MTDIWQVYDIGCHMTVIYLSYHWIRHVVIYMVHTGIYQSYDIGNWRVVWIIYDSLCLSYDLLLESRRSGPQQNRAWNAAAHRVWIARVFIVPVHHSTRRCHWAAVTASLGQATAAEDDAGGHKVAPPTSAAVVVSWLCRAALAADCRVQKQMTSVGTKMN